jgi:hypothetical protein
MLPGQDDGGKLIEMHFSGLPMPGCRLDVVQSSLREEYSNAIE